MFTFNIGNISRIMLSDKDNKISVDTKCFTCTPDLQHNAVCSLRSNGDQNLVSGCVVKSISYKRTQSNGNNLLSVWFSECLCHETIAANGFACVPNPETVPHHIT
jgi:hypothetical protein